MTAQTRTVLKALFENGDKPQGSDYSDMIDSFISIADSSAQSVASHVTFSGGLATTTLSAATALITTLDVSTVSAATGTISTLTANAASAQSVATSSLSMTKGRSGTTGKFGDVIVRQKATVRFSTTVQTSLFSIPDGSDIIGIYVYTTDGFTDTAGNQNLKIGISGDDDYFASVPVSGTGFARATPTSAVRWLNCSGTAAAVRALVTAVTTVAVSGQAVIEVVYVGAY